LLFYQLTLFINGKFAYCILGQGT